MKAFRLTALALTTTLVLGAAAGTAWAPRVKLLPATGTACMVDLDKGTFRGTFALQSFTVQDAVPMAVGELIGTCSTAEVDMAVPDALLVAVPMRVSSATCDAISIDFGDAVFPAGASKMAVSLSATTLVPQPKQVRGQFCAFAQQLRVRPLTALVAELNRIFARLS